MDKQKRQKKRKKRIFTKKRKKSLMVSHKEVVLHVLSWKLFVVEINGLFFKKKLFFGILLIVLSSLFAIGGTYLLIKANESFAANFADTVLRPTIGNQNTIFLESLFFNIEDHTNKLKYEFIKPNSLVFSVNAATVEKTATASSSFLLTPIPALNIPQTLPGEGMWTTVVSSTEGTLIAKTFIQPDPDRSYAIVALVKMNINNLRIGAVAGTREPGGPMNPGSGTVPFTIQKSNSLIAAFNGGFQKKDGYYGMIVGKKIYLSLKKDLATFVVFQHTKPIIVRYTGQDFGSDVNVIRQNGPMLVENSHIVTSSSAWNMQTWGLTTTNSMYTWRSGIGVTKDGNLIYACGPSLVPETLAKALQMAGAVNAMQLDINPIWVRYVLFTSLGNGSYSYYPLETAMVNGGYQYLHGFQKDFFYVYKK